jgi:hypothetical protein
VVTIRDQAFLNFSLLTPKEKLQKKWCPGAIHCLFFSGLANSPSAQTSKAENTEKYSAHNQPKGWEVKVNFQSKIHLKDGERPRDFDY